MIVYLARNRTNGKAYVGKTKRSLERRWKEHCKFSARGSCLAIHCAIRKYGAENFDVSVIQQCSDEAELNIAEKKWIAELGTLGCGYNMTLGGDGGSKPGRIVDKETREKIAVVAKQRYADGHGELMRSRRRRGVEHPFAGKDWGRKGPLSEEAKAKVSAARKGRALSEPHKAAIATSCVGRISPKAGKSWTDAERRRHAALRHLKKKPVFGYDMAGTCMVAYLSLEDAAVATGLGWRILAGNRKVYSPKYVDGITYRRSELTIGQLKERS